MAPCLEDCPNELVALIVDLLPLHDICSLRQTCRTLAAKAAQDTFKSFFHHKRVFLTRDSLQRFSNATKPGLLGCLLRTLTVTGVVINTNKLAQTVRSPHSTAQAREDAQRHLDILLQRRAVAEEFHKSGLDVTMLSETFSTLAACGRCLALSTRLVVYRTDSEQVLEPHEGGDLRPIWYLATRTYRTAMQAMTASQIRIEAFDVYTKDDGCSIACNELNDSGGNAESGRFLSIKSFAMSFSDRYLRETEEDSGITGESIEIDWPSPRTKRDLQTIQAEADDENNFTGLAHLLRKFPHLVTLELHFYRFGYLAGVHRHATKYLEHILEAAPLPQLRNLTLRGFVTRERDLLRLMERTPLQSMSLENVCLVEGSFQTIFDSCTSESSQIEKLHFDDLFEGGHVQFDGPGLLKYAVQYPRGKTDRPRSHILDRSGMEVKQTISYAFPQGRTKASARLYSWRNSRRRQYGIA